ncbi:MAG: HNH endonuclease domain-containing protein [Promethearchaeota archaeon]
MKQDFLNTWLEIIRNAHINNTYKMAWARAITEIACELDIKKEEIHEITLYQIGEKFLKYYWNQTIFFNLNQGSNPSNPPRIFQLTKELIQHYQKIMNSRRPIKFERIDFNEKNLKKQYTKTLKQIESTLKRDVSYRFLRLSKKKIDNVYDYKQNDDRLFISKNNLKILKLNNQLIFELINYRWAQILEDFNFSPRICKKIRILDRDVERGSLKKFGEYLDLANSERTCFICKKQIDPNDISIDHVIPWSFMYSDDLWNLVYVHKSCNSSKSNRLPSERDIFNLEERNVKLLDILKAKGIQNKMRLELELAIKQNLVRKFWISYK